MCSHIPAGGHQGRFGFEDWRDAWWQCSEMGEPCLVAVGLWVSALTIRPDRLVAAFLTHGVAWACRPTSAERPLSGRVLSRWGARGSSAVTYFFKKDTSP